MVHHQTHWKTSAAQKLLATACNRIPTVARYALDVLTGNIPASRLVFRAVERLLDDLARPDFAYHFDQGSAVSIIKFFRDLAFPLQPFEQFIVANIYGWKDSSECEIHPGGHRRFQTAYIEIGKGNRKTPLAAGIAVYGIAADDEPAAEVYIAGPGKEQAAICFRDAVRIVNENQHLRRVVKQHGCNGKMLSGNLSIGACFARPVSAEHKTLHGPRPHTVVADELHEHSSTMVLDVLTAGFKARHQPLSFEITNSGWDRNTICWYHHEHSQRVIDHMLEDEQWFAFVCGLDPCAECQTAGRLQPDPECEKCDNWLDPDVWIKPNPGLGTTLQRAYLEKQVKDALNIPSQQTLVIRLNFCIWTQSVTRAINPEQWRQCSGLQMVDGIPESPEAWRNRMLIATRGKACFGGMDLGSTIDLVATGFWFPKQPGLAKDVLLPFFFIPSSSARQRTLKDRIPFDVWERQGFVIVTQGSATDYTVVRNQILEINANCDLIEMGYDPWNADQMVQLLIADGVNMVKHRQSIGEMTDPTKSFLKAVVSAEFEHGNNPALTWNAGNLVTHSDANGNLRPVKPENPGSAAKIDGIVASIVAKGRANANPELTSDPEVFFL